MLNVGVIGIGNCGNQIACLAHKDAKCDVYAINSSENDLATLPADIPRKSVGEGEGTGKNRAEAKKYLKKSIMEMVRDEDFKNFITGKDVIMIVSSTGGGSGSGMSPVLSDIIRQSFKNPDGSEKLVILVGVLPRLNEGYSTQVNALDYLHELYGVLDNPTYMLYDNNNYSKETSYVVLKSVNQAVVDDIKVIQCKYNAATPYDSIDERDMKTLLSTPGRIVISSLIDLKEKDLDEATIETKMIERLKKNAHAELQRDGIIIRTGLITNLNERLNATFDTHIDEIRKFVGEPVEEFVHIAVNEERALPNNVFLILAGLSKVSDRIEKIEERITEIDAQQEKKMKELDADKEITGDDIARMNAKRQYRPTGESADSVDLQSIFGKFDS